MLRKYYKRVACDMPRSSPPGTGFSSSAPSHLRCLAVLTAAWGAAGFRPTLQQIIRRASQGGASPPSITHSCGGVVERPAAARFPGAAYGTQCFTSQSRGGSCTVLAVHSRGETAVVEDSDDGAGPAGPVVAVDERPWLGNGADPMAEDRKSLPSSLAAAEAEGGRGEKGKGVPTEELWMNGPFQAPVAPGPVDVIYVDDDIVVVNKPSGLLCVPGRAERDSLATRVALELGHYRVDRMIVHRLDMATSGVVVLARSDAALKELNRQFRERDVRKRYVAMVHGVVPADEGEVDLPLCKNMACPPLQMVNMEQGKPSLTQWQVVERAADRTRVSLVPVSGRSHQLRLHMDAIGHPILGDHFYGTKESLALADRCLLHAQMLCIRHPITGEPRMFTAPCEF